MAGSNENEQTFSKEEKDDENSDEIVDNVETVKFNNGQYTMGGETEVVLICDENPTEGEEQRHRRCCLCCINCRSRCRKQRQNDKSNVSKNEKETKKQSSQVRNLSKGQHRKEMCWNCCKKFTAFLFSHIGLCGLVIAYSIMGGFVFMSLESSHELLERGSMDMRRKVQVERLWNITEVSLILGKKNWTYEVEKVLREFQTDIFEATKLRGWDGQSEDADAQWSFANSLLYSITVITTIGKISSH